MLAGARRQLMRPLLVAALAALLALAVGAWLVLGDQAALESSVEAAGPGALHSATTEDGVVRLRGAETSTGAVDDAGPDGRTALSAQPDAKEASGDGSEEVRLTGRVVAYGGTPIEAATVYVARDQGWPGPPLDSQFYASWANRKETTTDADGRFALEGLQHGAANLAVRAAGFAPLDQGELQVTGPAEQDLGDLELVRGAVLTGTVVDDHGAPVAGADLVRPDESGFLLFGQGGARGAVLATSDEDGAFRVDTLAPGPWKLLVVTPDHPDLVTEGTTDRTRLTVVGLVLRLAPGHSISGRVVAPEGTDWSTLRVRARPSGPLQIDPTSGRVPWRETACAPDGSFNVGGLAEEGLHKLQVLQGEVGSRRGQPLSESVEARTGARDVVLTVVESSTLTFRLVDASTQRPLEKYTIDLLHRRQDKPAGSERLSSGDDRVARDAQGVTTVQDLRELRTGLTTRVSLFAPGHRAWTSEPVELVRGQQVDLGRIALEPMPAMVVRVEDASRGEAIEGATVTLRAVPIDSDPTVSPPPYGEATARTSADGLAHLSLVEGSTGVLGASHEGFASSAEVEVALDAFEPAQGEPDQVLRLERGGSVAVRGVDPAGAPVPGAQVTQTRTDVDGPTGSQTTDARGLALFEHLPVGAHAFEVPAQERGGFVISFGDSEPEAGDPRSRAQVEVVEGERAQVTLVRPARGRLVGRITEAGLALSGAGLRLDESGARGGFVIPGLTDQPWTHTDGAGRYAIEPVKPGSYDLVVQHRSRLMDTRVPVTIGEGETTLDVDLPLTGIAGRVSDAHGRPVEGAVVEVSRQHGGGSSSRLTFLVNGGQDDDLTMTMGGAAAPSVRTGPNGLYELHGVLPDVDLIVSVRHPEHREATSDPVRLAPGELRSGLDFTLGPAGRLEVVVRTAAGKPAMRIGVSAHWAGDEKAGVEDVSASTDAKGVARLDGLAPGAWTLTAQPHGWDAKALARIEPRAVTVVEGELGHVELDLP